MSKFWENKTLKTKKTLRSTHLLFSETNNRGLPNVLCEAMLCECIPIGNKVFGIPEVIGDTGFIFEGTKDIDKVCLF